MKTNLKKILLPIGAIAVVTIPTSITISCGMFSPTNVKKSSFTYQELDLDANINVAFAQINRTWVWANRDKLFTGWMSLFYDVIENVIPIRSFNLKYITVHITLNKYASPDGIIKNEPVIFKIIINGF